ncbi:MAG: PAS domain S-box protein [Cytophagales bacterium]|nr:PAS domain S-box protein [Cytophagales bacterium]
MTSKHTHGFGSSKIDLIDLLKNSTVNFWFWELETDYMSWAKGTFELFDMKVRNENMLEYYRKQLQPKDEKNLLKTKDQILETGQTTIQFVNRIKTAKGKTKWIEVIGEVIREGGKPVALFGVGHDISHLKQEEIELRTIQTQTKTGFWNWTPDNGTYWSSTLRDIAEIPENDPPPGFGSWLREYIHPDDRDRVSKEIKKGLSSNKPTESIHRFISYKGNEMVVRSISMPSPIQKDKVVGLVQNITKVAKAKIEFQEQSQLVDDILQTMIGGVAKVNMDGIITFANEAALTFLEDPKMVGRYHMSGEIDQIDEDGNVINPSDMPLSRTLKSGEKIRNFVHGLTIKNKVKWFSVNSAPLMSDGKRIGAIANFIETTKEVEARQKLKESEQRYRLIVENTGDIITLYRLDGMYEYISPNILEIRGYTQEEVLNRKPYDFLHPDDIPMFKIVEDKVRKGKKSKFKHRDKHKNGEYKWYESIVHPIYDDHNNIKFVQNTVHLIHDQKLAEDRLVESEEKFKALAENLPGLIYLTTNDDEYSMTFINDDVKRVTGYSKEDFLTGMMTIVSLIHADDLEHNIKKLKTAINNDKTFALEYRLQKKSGEWIWVKDTGVGIKDSDGNLKFVEGYIEDITDAKKINEETRLNEQKFRILFNDSGHSIGITDGQGVFIDANKKFLDLTGYSLQELKGKKTFLDLTHPEDILVGQEQLASMISGKISSYQVEKRYVSKSNRIIYFRVSISHFKDPETGEIRIVGTADDITESRLAAEKVKLNERKFRSLFENAGNAILITDISGKIVEINNQAEPLLGYKRKEAERKLTIQEIMAPEGLASNEKIIQKISKGRTKSVISENRYITKSGESFWAQENVSSYLDETTGETMLIRIIENITERRNYIREIQASELRLRSVFEEAGHGVAITGANGDIIRTNKKFRQIFGLTKKDIRNKTNALHLVHPDYRDIAKNQFKQLLDNPATTVQSEAKYITKKSKTIWVRLNGSAYLDPITNELRLVGIVEDITQRQEAVEKVRISEEFQHETINALSIALMVMKTDGKIERTNLVWDRITSDSKDLNKATLGNNFLQVVKKLPLGLKISSEISEILNGHSDLLELELPLDVQGNKWYALRASMLNPEFDSLVITLQDVTIRKRIEQALEESLSKYRNTYNMTPVMMHSIDKNGVLLSVSDFWLEKLGYQRHEIIGKHLQEFLTNESKKDAEIILPVFFQKGSILDVSYNFLTKNGEVLETLLSAIQEGKGKSARSLAVVTDITPLKKAERLLRKSRYDLEEAQHIAQIGNYEYNFQEAIFSSSEVYDKILELEEEIQKPSDFLLKIIPPEDLNEVTTFFTESTEKGGMFEYSGQVITLKNKKRIWIEVLGKVIKKKGIPVKLVGTIQNITKGKIAELEIQKLSQRLTLATRSAGIGVWEENFETHEQQWDDQMTQIYGTQLKSSKQSLEITHPDDKHIMETILQLKADGAILIDETRRIVVNDKVKHVRTVVRQIFNKEGDPIKQVGITLDVSEDQELLGKLESSLLEKNILIKEVHHRVKNNMQMISSILSLKSLDLTDEDSKNIFNDCTTRIKSMALVHDQLYRFYDVSEIDISEYLNHLLSGLHSLLGGNAGYFVVNVHAESYTINVDQALLCGLIVSEMVANAFKHGFKDMKEGGVDVTFKVKKTKKILIVTNNGSKIPGDLLETRTSSLGMSLIKTFVKQLDGSLTLHPDNGFMVEF